MTRDEIVAALRCCAGDNCAGCPYDEIFDVEDAKCIGKAMGIAADLIENQQHHIAALMQANAALRDTILRRDAQIAAKDTKTVNHRNTGEIKKYGGKRL